MPTVNKKCTESDFEFWYLLEAIYKQTGEPEWELIRWKIDFFAVI